MYFLLRRTQELHQSHEHGTRAVHISVTFGTGARPEGDQEYHITTCSAWPGLKPRVPDGFLSNLKLSLWKLQTREVVNSRCRVLSESREERDVLTIWAGPMDSDRRIYCDRPDDSSDSGEMRIAISRPRSDEQIVASAQSRPLYLRTAKVETVGNYE